MRKKENIQGVPFCLCQCSSEEKLAVNVIIKSVFIFISGLCTWCIVWVSVCLFVYMLLFVSLCVCVFVFVCLLMWVLLCVCVFVFIHILWIFWVRLHLSFDKITQKKSKVWAPTRFSLCKFLWSFVHVHRMQTLLMCTGLPNTDILSSPWTAWVRHSVAGTQPGSYTIMLQCSCLGHYLGASKEAGYRSWNIDCKQDQFPVTAVWTWCCSLCCTGCIAVPDSTGLSSAPNVTMNV